MKKGLCFYLFIAAFVVSANSQSTKYLGKQLKLVGKWELNTMDFGYPVDLNNDGISSKNAITELSCCNQEYIEFNGQYESKHFCKSKGNDCTENELTINYTWEIVEKEINVVKMKEGERVVQKEKHLFIDLKDKEGIESRSWIIKEIKRKSMIVIDYRRDGSDTTSPCKLIWEKI
jgi:hypothetical protein